MLNNSLQWAGLTVRQNTGGRGAGWDQILRAWYPQVRVGKTDILKRPYKGHFMIFNTVALIAPLPRHIDCKPWIGNTNWERRALRWWSVPPRNNHFYTGNF